MKKWSILLCVVVLLASMAGTALASEPPGVFVNGKALVSPNPPVIEDGRTLVPLYAIFNALNQPVNWHSEDSTITSGLLWLQIDNTEAKIADIPVNLDVPAQIIDSRTYVPLSFIATALGKEVKWDGDHNRIDINDQGVLDFTVNSGELNGDVFIAKGAFTNKGKSTIARIEYVVIRITMMKDDGSFVPFEARFTDLPLDIEPGGYTEKTLYFIGAPQYKGASQCTSEIVEGKYVFK